VIVKNKQLSLRLSLLALAHQANTIPRFSSGENSCQALKNTVLVNFTFLKTIHKQKTLQIVVLRSLQDDFPNY